MKKILILLLILTNLSSTGNAQEPHSFTMAYSIAMPAGSLSDYISSTSFRGFNLEYNRRLQESWVVGLESGWNSFHERTDSKVYTEKTMSISGIQYRNTLVIPIVAGAKYHFSSSSKVKPYGGIGLGTLYLNRDTDFGLYRISTDTWQFAYRPELGIKYEYQPGQGILFGVKYYGATGNDDLDGQSYISLNVGIVL